MSPPFSRSRLPRRPCSMIEIAFEMASPRPGMSPRASLMRAAAIAAIAPSKSICTRRCESASGTPVSIPVWTYAFIACRAVVICVSLVLRLLRIRARQRGELLRKVAARLPHAAHYRIERGELRAQARLDHVQPRRQLLALYADGFDGRGDAVDAAVEQAVVLQHSPDQLVELVGVAAREFDRAAVTRCAADHFHCKAKRVA